MVVRRLVVVLCLAAACAACSGDSGGGSSIGPPLPCTPGAVAACPCIGEGMGTQTCNADGKSYAECTGCPVASGGTAAPVLPVPDAGALAVPDAARDGATDTGTKFADGGVAIGTSCGVGLPVLCEVGTELCCVRSLATDTCVDADDDAGCACDIAGCEVLKVRCDGPEDCAPGEVCCGTLGGGSTYVSFECATTCQYRGNQRQACHVGTDACPGTYVCANSQILTNVQVCIDPSTIEQ